MRLLHVVPTYLPAVRYGGPIWAVHGLCRALAARGHEVHVYTTNVDGPAESAVPLDTPVEIDGVLVHYFACRWPRRLYYSPAMATRLRSDVAGFDVVHCHSAFLWPPWAAARAARRARRPYLMSPHGMLVPDLIRQRGRWRKAAWIRLFDGPVLRSAAGIHVASEPEAAGVAALGFPDATFRVVPFGVEFVDEQDEESRPRHSTGGLGAEERRCDGAPMGPSPGSPRRRNPTVDILFLGRLSWKKGLDVLIAALAEVPGTCLTVAGNDDEGLTPGLRTQADSLGLGNRVRFVGPVYGADKWALLRSARVFALPSRGENFAVAVLEAMASGVPVVLSREVGLAAEVQAARAGLVVDANPTAVAAGLRAVLEDGVAAAAMGAAGRQLARTRFSWAAVAEQMEAVLQTVTTRR